MQDHGSYSHALIDCNEQEEDKAGELFSYGQILAVFDDGFGDGVFVEVRWFQKPQELNAMRKKKYVEQCMCRQFL